MKVVNVKGVFVKGGGLPFELGGEVLGQGLCEALSSNAVVSVSVENPEHSSVDLQHCHTQRCPAQLIHQDMAVNTCRKIIYLMSALVNLKKEKKKGGNTVLITSYSYQSSRLPPNGQNS